MYVFVGQRAEDSAIIQPRFRQGRFNRVRIAAEGNHILEVNDEAELPLAMPSIAARVRNRSRAGNIEVEELRSLEAEKVNR
jgi:hypothetical protein